MNSASKRIYLPKPDGRERPIGIAALEDKVLQKALLWVLQCIYEKDFVGFSYGFRPGKSQHQALDAVTVALQGNRVNWVLDADVEGFFDAIDHEWLVQFLEHRIGDQRVLRLIRKWLTAGVSDDGQWSLVVAGDSRLVQLPRDPRQHDTTATVPRRDRESLAGTIETSLSTPPLDLGSNAANGSPPVADTKDTPPVPRQTFSRSTQGRSRMR